MPRIIVVDDDSLARKILTRMLEPGFQVASFENGADALDYLKSNGADIVLTDMKMPRMGGLELLKAAKDLDPELIVFIITGHSSLEGAVAAVKQGAYDFIAKPFDPDDVMIRINRALKEKQLTQTVSAYRLEREQHIDRYTPMTRNKSMLNVLEMARKAARTDSTILIQGETGVGKELVAKSIHQWSGRFEHPFVAVNCGALATGVLESELFGHEKGAFTGATTRRAGYFEQASQGTLFLDEIGTTDPHFQIRLLRVLQERSICRVGSSVPVPVNCRIIAATNQDLQSDVAAGKFRQDLFYRLSIVTLDIPPLRSRPEDIPILAEHFVKMFRHINSSVKGISPDGAILLASYDFPGNVRELENIIERAMILESGSLLTPKSLLINKTHGDSQTNQESLKIEEAEREHILKVLECCNGKKSEAAKILGINKTTLWRKMKRYGLEQE